MNMVIKLARFVMFYLQIVGDPLDNVMNTHDFPQMCMHDFPQKYILYFLSSL